MRLLEKCERVARVLMSLGVFPKRKRHDMGKILNLFSTRISLDLGPAVKVYSPIEGCQYPIDF